MTAEEIITRAKKYVGVYVYWYGGKGERCNAALLNRLATAYPSIYTEAYIAKCKEDINAGKYCIDCSGLVCACYGIAHRGTEQFGQVFNIWTGEPKNGMILYRKGHCGIYYNGRVIEARGKAYGVTAGRVFSKSDWTRIYYSTAVDYTGGQEMKRTAKEYLTCAINVIAGAYATGESRKKKIGAEGYDYNIVQALVNYALKGEKANGN